MNESATKFPLFGNKNKFGFEARHNPA